MANSNDVRRWLADADEAYNKQERKSHDITWPSAVTRAEDTEQGTRYTLDTDTTHIKQPSILDRIRGK